MFKSVFIKKFRIIFICFCFIQNKCYSEDCCEICYNCCCNCLNSKDKKTSVFDNTNKEKSYTYNNKKSETNSEKKEEEEGNNENEENEEKEDLGYKYKKKANKGKKELNTILEEEEEEEKEESEKKEKNEKKEEEEENEEEDEENEEENEENEEENEEKALNDYLQSVFKKFKRIKPIEDDFFKAQETYVLKKRGTKKNDGILGEGGFGLVYKIRNKKNKKTFVLKKSVVKEEDLEDIKNEIRNLIRFKDEKNILRIVDVYKQDNFGGKFLKKKYLKKDKATCFYIITEYCKNGDLYDFIKNKKISDKKNLRDKIAYQIINAVHSCHSKNITHRDLKPENFFLDENYNVKLGDFGFSKKFSENEKDTESVYTRNFACYEILLKKERDPFKADLFSLGVTLFVLYTGKNLLKVNTEMEKEEIKEKFNAIPTTIDDSISNHKLNDLLKNLLKRKEKNRCGWDEILKSEFYKSLKEKFEKN